MTQPSTEDPEVEALRTKVARIRREPLARLAQLNPDDLHDAERIAVAARLQAKKQTAAALRFLEAAASSPEPSPYVNYRDVYLRLIEHWRGAGRHERALEYLEQLCAYDRQRAPAMLRSDRRLMAGILADDGQGDRALAIWRSLVAEQPGDGMVLLDLAGFLRRQRQFPQAIQCLERAAEAWRQQGYTRLVELAEQQVASVRQEAGLPEPPPASAYATEGGVPILESKR